MPLPFYLHTDLCFYFPLLNVKRAYPPNSLNSCICLVFATELTGTKGVTLFTYTNFCFYFLSGVSDRIGDTLFTYTDLYCSLFFNRIANGTKGKDYPFNVHRHVCLIQ